MQGREFLHSIHLAQSRSGRDDDSTERNASRVSHACWSLRDFIAASLLFLSSAAVVLWQNAHVAVLWDISYTLDTSLRIALGQMPYRDFPLVHAPGTFLVQAAIIRLFGRLFFHHVLYAAVVGGLGTVLAWRIVLHRLREAIAASWTVSLLLAAPLTVLGIYAILPFPSYDCDCIFSVLIVVLLLQRLSAGPSFALTPRSGRALLRPFIAGAVLPLPLFFKQNIGLPLLLATFVCLLVLIAHRMIHGAPGSHNTPGTAALGAVLSGSSAALIAFGLVLHFTAGLHNYFHWTIWFAAQRRLPGMQAMLEVYQEPSLLWWLPCVGAALVLLKGRLSTLLWARITALILLAAPLLWTLAGLFFFDDADDRASSLLGLWPLLLVLSCALALRGLWLEFSLRTVLPVLILVAIHGTLLSQQLWGSTYAIWPLLVILFADMIAFLATRPAIISYFPILPSFLAALFAATLLVSGSLYTASEERLSYAQLAAGPVLHSAVPALEGMNTSGPFLPEFDGLLQFVSVTIPASDGVVLLPGEDPFCYATGRVPQFPVLLFDNATDPYSPEQLVEELRHHNIRWLIVKTELQIKEDPTPQRDAVLTALQHDFLPYCRLTGYVVYRRR